MKSSLNSYAKLNLYLALRNKRADNYHNIKTIFERINLHDSITLTPRPDNKIKIICSSKDVPKGPQNFAYLSAKLLQDKFKINKGVNIKIVKRIPVASGLGGGSSNAATVLLGLNSLWRLRLTRGELAELAAKIGSDVPFFIYDSRFAQGLGRGEKITPLGILRKICLWHILVVPRIKVATAAIYRGWDNVQKSRKAGLTKSNYDVKIFCSFLGKADIQSIGRALFNDLEPISKNLYPEIQDVKQRLVSLGLEAVLMSGSGPAVFGIASSRRQAQALYRELKSKDRSWQVFLVRTR